MRATIFRSAVASFRLAEKTSRGASSVVLK
jgi:hypothetical protein